MIEAAKRSGKWSERGPSLDFAMPPELAARLKRDKRAARFFETLAPSDQRQYVAWIATAKRRETKERRLAEAMALLKRGEKLGMR